MENKSIIDRLGDDLKTAMKARDTERTATLRMLVSAMNYRRIDLNLALSNDEQQDVVRKQVKQREDSITEYVKGKRQDLADKESREREILKEYLPADMDPAQLRTEVNAIVAGLAADAKFGDAMKAAMGSLAKRANGKAIQEAVKAAMAARS
jgi:uncharacterized protein